MKELITQNANELEGIGYKVKVNGIGVSVVHNGHCFYSAQGHNADSLMDEAKRLEEKFEVPIEDAIFWILGSVIADQNEQR